MVRILATKSDLVLLGTTFVLVVLGIAMIYSCTHADSSRGLPRYWLQVIWLVLGLGLLVLVNLFDYARLQPLAVGIYLTTLVLMALVLAIGATVRGAQRWIPIGPLHLQPTELVKISAVIMVAAYLSRREELAVDARAVVATFAMVAPAMLLAAAQPDLGTPVVLLGAWLCILFVAGAPPAQLVAVVAFLVWGFVGAWSAGLIRPHQKERLLAFANPEADPQGAGWQVKQALIAVGSGCLLGQGYLRGTQTQLNFIPDQEADFIFTAVAEELGLVGALATLSLLGLLLYRGLSIAGSARDTFGRLLAAGFVGVLGTHILINVAMTLGLAPVKGMPLPLLSYGGSHLLTCMIIIGLLNSIHVRRRRIDFDL